jgi:hypothetical protein
VTITPPLAHRYFVLITNAYYRSLLGEELRTPRETSHTPTTKTLLVNLLPFMVASQSWCKTSGT